jgi:hypothetical protein
MNHHKTLTYQFGQKGKIKKFPYIRTLILSNFTTYALKSCLRCLLLNKYVIYIRLHYSLTNSHLYLIYKAAYDVFDLKYVL